MNNRKREEIINTLKNVSIFKQFAQRPKELEKLANIMNIVYVKKGETIIKEGEEGDTSSVQGDNQKAVGGDGSQGYADDKGLGRR